MADRPGRWTWTCHVQHPDAAKGARPGCGRHEHHPSPKAADATARVHQAGHALENGCPPGAIPEDPKDPAWGTVCSVYDVPLVSMDSGSRRPGCRDCDALNPKAGPDFYG